MKTLKLVGIAVVLFFVGTLQSQISVSVNIPTPPLWGPIGSSDARYYYIPDVESYYDTQTSMFIYYEGGVWIRRGYLPARYRSYDLYNGYKVVIPNYHGSNPYFYYKQHRSQYAKGYRGHPQPTYGENPRNKNNKFKNQPNNRPPIHNGKRQGKGNKGRGNGKH